MFTEITVQNIYCYSLYRTD